VNNNETGTDNSFLNVPADEEYDDRTHVGNDPGNNIPARSTVRLGRETRAQTIAVLLFVNRTGD